MLVTNKHDDKLTLGVFVGSNWDVPSGDTYKEIDDIIMDFNDKHENVTVSYLPGILKEDYQEWLSQCLIKDEFPDVLIMPSMMYETFARSGALKNLDSFIENDSDISLNEYYQSSIAPCNIGGSYYALPYKSVPDLMFVNEDLLNKLEISKPDNNWGWEDFYEICQKVKSYNDTHNEQVYAYAGYDWTKAVYSNDISLYNENNNEVYVNDDKFIEAIKYMRMLNNLQVATDDIEDFDNGKALFCVMNYSDYRTYSPYPWRIKKFSDFNWDYISLPKGIQGNTVSEVDTLMVAVSSRTDNSKVAWELLKYIVNDINVQSNMVKNSEALSPLIQVMQDNISDEFYDPETIDDIMMNSVAVKRTKQYNDIKDMANIEIKELLNNDYDIENAMIKLRNKIIEYLKS